MIDVPLLIDTSVALNLLATEVSTALIESFGVACFVSSAVYDETIYIRSEDPTQTAGTSFDGSLAKTWLRSRS